MVMVTESHVAVLRALLAGDGEEFDRLTEQISDVDSWEGLNYLAAAACHEMIYRAFGDGYTVGAVIHFVGEQRAQLFDSEDDFDARIAERLILASLGNGSLDGIDERAKGQAQIGLLTAMVDRENFDDAGLDELLSAARKVADGTRS